MSRNCTRCCLRPRTEGDLLCDVCRKPEVDGYYWVTLFAGSTPQIVQVLTGTAWSDKPSTVRRAFVMLVGNPTRILLSDFLAQYPEARWSVRLAAPRKEWA